MFWPHLIFFSDDFYWLQLHLQDKNNHSWTPQSHPWICKKYSFLFLFSFCLHPSLSNFCRKIFWTYNKKDVFRSDWRSQNKLIAALANHKIHIHISQLAVFSHWSYSLRVNNLSSCLIRQYELFEISTIEFCKNAWIIKKVKVTFCRYLVTSDYLFFAFAEDLRANCFSQ